MALSLLLIAGLAVVTVRAQDAERGEPVGNGPARQLFDTWLSQQMDLLPRIESFSIASDVVHRVEGTAGNREARYGILYRRSESEDLGRGDVQYFVLDGDTLNVSERRRVERTISSMITPELGPLLNGLRLPTFMLGRARQVDAPVRIQRGERSLIRFTFLLESPEPGARQDGPARGRPGMGVPPGGRRPPGGMRPPPGGGREAPPPRIAAIFDEATGHLVMTRIQIRMPGERVLMAETRFHRVEGLDLPLSRTVRGTFPQERRLRTVTVRLDHETRFSQPVVRMRN
jgi:hypothetical protein